MSQELREMELFAYAPMNGALDAINRRLLAELRRDPRLTMAELGRRVGMSSPAVTERVRRLEDAGIIARYRPDLHPAPLRLPLAPFIPLPPHPCPLPPLPQPRPNISRVVKEHTLPLAAVCYL